MTYEKNTDPNYFDAFREETNCGSYAFNICGWYAPDYFDSIFSDGCNNVEQWIVQNLINGWTIDEITESYTDMIVECVMHDFSGEVREVEENYEPAQDEELIALRCYCSYDSYDDWADWDFHFKVLRDGLWVEKCGRNPVQFCSKDDWDYRLRSYTGKTVYFSHKIAQNNLKNSEILSII